MIECPFCYRVFRQPPENLGARCPKCRMPLYEDPAKRKRAAEKDYGPCKQHPDAGSIAECSRCGKPICQNCRTRWHVEPVCPNCVDQSIAQDEPSPVEAMMQGRQAWFSLVLALFGWMLLLLTLGPLATFHQTPVEKAIIFITYACFLGSFLPGVFAPGLRRGGNLFAGRPSQARRHRPDLRRFAAGNGDRRRRAQPLAQLTPPLAVSRSPGAQERSAAIGCTNPAPFLIKTLMHIHTLTIVGVGLIGGSIGLAAKARGVAERIIGVGRDPAKLELARRLGAIDDSRTGLGDAMAGTDFAVFCTPVDRIASQVQEAAQHAKPGAIFTDAGSTKEQIVAAIDAVRFVGGHPLAGSEKKGPNTLRPSCSSIAGRS